LTMGRPVYPRYIQKISFGKEEAPLAYCACAEEAGDEANKVS
jgi:hypothetical protein